MLPNYLYVVVSSTLASGLSVPGGRQHKCSSGLSVRGCGRNNFASGLSLCGVMTLFHPDYHAVPDGVKTTVSIHEVETITRLHMSVCMRWLAKQLYFTLKFFKLSN